MTLASFITEPVALVDWSCQAGGTASLKAGMCLMCLWKRKETNRSRDWSVQSMLHEGEVVKRKHILKGGQGTDHMSPGKPPRGNCIVFQVQLGAMGGS